MSKSNTSYQDKQVLELVEADAEVREVEARVERLLDEGYSVDDIYKIIAPEHYFILTQGD